MRYIDTGAGDPRGDALFAWLKAILAEEVVAIHWQSGFFEASVLGVFLPTLRRLARENLDAVVLIGSNDGDTQPTTAHQLVDVLGLPRPGARLGIVTYVDALFHPKTVHVSCRDGRQAAYVGSANLTARGISGLNVEAGIVLDTNDSDPAALLAEIRQATRDWFTSRPAGLFEIRNHDDVNRLEAQGLLKADRSRPPRPSDGASPADDPRPRRSQRHALPTIPAGEPDADREHPDAFLDSLDHPILIAELAGPGRWGQAAFPEWFVIHFFQVLPDTADLLRLWPVTRASGARAWETTPCGYKAGSRNWCYELRLAARIGDYPPPPSKPIGVFHRIARHTFRYTILMPDDDAWPHVSRCLSNHSHLLRRPATELPRAIIAAAVLRDAWPESWFFEPDAS